MTIDLQWPTLLKKWKERHVVVVKTFKQHDSLLHFIYLFFFLLLLSCCWCVRCVLLAKHLKKHISLCTEGGATQYHQRQNQQQHKFWLICRFVNYVSRQTVLVGCGQASVLLVVVVRVRLVLQWMFLKREIKSLKPNYFKSIRLNCSLYFLLSRILFLVGWLCACNI